MEFGRTDIDGMLLAFATEVSVDGIDFTGIYLKDWIEDLDTMRELHYIHIPTQDLGGFTYSYGTTVEVPEENFTGVVKEVTTDGAGFVILKLRKK